MSADDVAEGELQNSRSPGNRAGTSSSGETLVISDNHPFGGNAVDMARAGFAVLPATGKKPIVGGFNKWKSPPGENTIRSWAERHADADLAYVPGLCRTKNGNVGLVVVDGDDAEASERAIEIFGDTPGKVNTRRGKHFLYDGAGVSLGKISSLKKFGLNADVKHGHSIVIAPPSRHEKEPGFCYSWDGCDHTVIGDLPPFDEKALRYLIERGSKTLPNTTRTAPPPRPPGYESARNFFRDGSRKLGLNDYLVGQAWAFEDFESALDVAETWNRKLPNKGLEMLPQEEVVGVVQTVIKDLEAGKLQRWLRRRATCTSNVDEIDCLMRNYNNGADAVALLLKLRAEHGGRVRRGETFVLVIDCMVRDRVMGLWAARRYRAARDTLLDAGLIGKVSPARRKVAAQYTLIEGLLKPP